MTSQEGKTFTCIRANDSLCFIDDSANCALSRYIGDSKSNEVTEI